MSGRSLQAYERRARVSEFVRVFRLNLHHRSTGVTQDKRGRLVDGDGNVVARSTFEGDEAPLVLVGTV